MKEFDKLTELHEDFSITWAEVKIVRREAEDMISAVQTRLHNERKRNEERIAELQQTMSDPSRSETVRRVAGAELARIRDCKYYANAAEVDASAVTKLNPSTGTTMWYVNAAPALLTVGMTTCGGALRSRDVTQIFQPLPLMKQSKPIIMRQPRRSIRDCRSCFLCWSQKLYNFSDQTDSILQIPLDTISIK